MLSLIGQEPGLKPYSTFFYAVCRTKREHKVVKFESVNKSNEKFFDDQVNKTDV